MTVVLRNIPAGYNWGWFSREDPRMHLQTVDRLHRGADAHKVWLEEKGKRVIEPVGSIPSRVLKSLTADLTPDRLHVEVQWVGFMIENDWIKLSLRGSVITVIAYPNHPGARFTRTVDLADHMPGVYDPTSLITPRHIPKAEDVTLSWELAAIEIWPKRDEGHRRHISLAEILWE